MHRNLKFVEMELGEMKRNTSNWSNFCMLLRRTGLSASAGLSCLKNVIIKKVLFYNITNWPQLINDKQINACIA